MCIYIYIYIYICIYITTYIVTMLLFSEIVLGGFTATSPCETCIATRLRPDVGIGQFGITIDTIPRPSLRPKTCYFKGAP